MRGCNFSRANLEGANFAQARIGLALGSLLWGWALLFGTGAIAFHVLSQLIFGIMGLTRMDPNYGLRMALVSILATVGALMGLITVLSRRAFLIVIAAVLEGALLGFFVGGLLSELSLTSAIYGSLTGGVVLGLGTYLWAARGFGLVVAVLGVAMANGMFFIAGVNTLQLWFVNQTVVALMWLAISLLYGWITLRAIGHLYRELRNMGWTSFAGANLHRVRWQ